MQGPEWRPSSERPVNRPLRVVLAILVFIPLLGVGVGYHDGLIGVDASREFVDGASYRFKGVVEGAGAEGEDEFFNLTDPSGPLRIWWNATDVEPGRTYVVVATYEGGESRLVGDAVVRVFFFR